MVDLLTCELSKWSGRKRHCRWCDKQVGERRRSWCSDFCYRQFSKNHRYTEARSACKRSARALCDCPPDVFRRRVKSPTTGGWSVRRTAKHRVCASCGKCEIVVGLLECNHKVPRLGDRSSYSCLHHASNLEMLCHQCHLVVTNEQRRLWTSVVRRKSRPKKVQPVKRSLSKRRVPYRRVA